MKRFNWKVALLALALAIALRGFAHALPLAADPCAQPIGDGGYKVLQIPLNLSTTAAVQQIAAVAGQRIYVCLFTGVTGGTTPTLQWQSGTGTNCATNNANLTGAYTLATASTITTPAFEGTELVTPVGSALCSLMSGTSPTYVGWMVYRQGP